MKYQDRLDALLQIIQAKETVSINELQSHYSSSFSTLQRDLNDLQNKGFLVRLYGKVISKTASSSLPALGTPIGDSMEAQKRSIGRATQRLLHENDTIYITHGSTTHEVARYIDPQMELTVFTDGLNIIEALRDKSAIKTFCLGGSINYANMRVERSPYVSSNFPNLNINKLIIGCAGISAKRGVTFYDFESVNFLTELLPQCEEIIVVLDHTKINRITMANFVDISRVHYLVTDSHVDPAVLCELERMGPRCIIADEAEPLKNL